MPQVSELSLMADALEFTGRDLVHYLVSPLQKLSLKPYQLDHQAILELLATPTLNQLN